MKIIAIGRNYIDHAKELNNPVPENPIIFLKPDTAVLKDNKDSTTRNSPKILVRNRSCPPDL